MAAKGANADLSPSRQPEEASRPPKTAVFLDRDGTLIRHRDYLADISDLELFEQTGEAIRLLNDRRIPAVLITNQSAVARGMLTEKGLQAIHTELQARLSDRGAFLDAIYYCPHHPDVGERPYRQTCSCRKPRPGMILRAARELGLTPGLSFMVGDSSVDVEAGRNAGCRTVLLDPDSQATAQHSADFVAADLLQAIRWILGEAE